MHKLVEHGHGTVEIRQQVVRTAQQFDVALLRRDQSI